MILIAELGRKAGEATPTFGGLGTESPLQGERYRSLGNRPVMRLCYIDGNGKDRSALLGKFLLDDRARRRRPCQFPIERPTPRLVHEATSEALPAILARRRDDAR